MLICFLLSALYSHLKVQRVWADDMYIDYNSYVATCKIYKMPVPINRAMFHLMKCKRIFFLNSSVPILRYGQRYKNLKIYII